MTNRIQIAAAAVVAAILAVFAAPPAAFCDDCARCGDVEVSGFVDASYSGNIDRGSDTFGLDQAEIDVTRCVDGRGALRADVEWVKNGDAWDLDVEQGYLDYVPVFADQVTFTLGKFNAPIGFELLDAPDMYQYSHGLVFDYGIPTNLTGAMVAAAVGEGVDVRAYIVNGWDRNDLGGKGPKTVGGRAGFSFGDGNCVGVSGIAGSETDDSGAMPVTFDRSVVDVDVTLVPAPGLLIGGELNAGFVDRGDADLEWKALLAMAHYDVNDWFGVTGRFDWFDDPDDFVFGTGLMETRTAFTVAPTFVLGDGMGALVELRVDRSTEDAFLDSDGEATSSTTSLALEMTYTY